VRALGSATAVLLLAGCACLVDDNVALMQTARSAADGRASGTPRAGTQHKASQSSAGSSSRKLDTALLQKSPAPNCDVEGASAPTDESGEAAETADPNLVEIARLQLERDCYKNAEASVRRKLDRLQTRLSPGS
jgi:hypothetical protein